MKNGYRKGPNMIAILLSDIDISKITRFDVYGEPSEELQKVLTSLGAQAYNLLAGFSR